LANIADGGDDSLPGHLQSHGDIVTFGAEGELTGFELYKTDGTVVGTSLVLDAYSGLADGFAAGMANGVIGNLRVYWGNSSSGIEPWVTDGTPAGTYQLLDICVASCDSIVVP